MAEKDQEPESKSQPAPNPNPPGVKAYTQQDVDKAVTDAVREATGKQGSKHKLEVEKYKKQINDLNTKNATLTGTVEDQKTQIDLVTNTVNEVSKDDADKKNLVRLTNELVNLKKEVQAERRQNVIDSKTNEATKAELEATRRENMIVSVAAKHKDSEGKAVSPEDLAELCDTFEIGANEEKILVAAGTKWSLADNNENPAKPPAPKVPYDKGDTEGGVTDMSEEEQLRADYPSMYQ
jgi:hypothetical protein